MLAIITAGIAKMIMNDVTSIAQTKSGIRFSVMPGARSLNTVAMMLDRYGSADDFRERDELRPEVAALADAILGTGERRVAEPPGVGADVQQKARRTA